MVEEEKEFIDKNYQLMHYADIAQHLKRNTETIRNYIQKNYGAQSDSAPGFEKESLENAIKKSIVWKELQKQFSKEELEKFVYHWRKIIAQFGSDILATEEMQAVDYIKTELIMDRVLRQQHSCMLGIADLEKKILEEKKNPNPDDIKISGWVEQISFYNAGLEEIVKQHKDLLDKKGKLLGQMKGTREARIKHLENSKENIPDWIKKIILSEHKRKELGMYMEKMRLAMRAEEIKLSKLFTYSDGIVQPSIMTTEIMKNIKTEEN